MANRTRTGSSSSGAFIRSRCIFPSGCWCWFRCWRLRASSGRRCARRRSLCSRLAFIGCLGALTLGYLLAYGSGDAGAGVTRHMWGGIALTICCAGVCAGAALVGSGQRTKSLSRTADLHAAGSAVDGAPGRLTDAWQQLPDRVHACADEAGAAGGHGEEGRIGARLLLRRTYRSHLRHQLRLLPRYQQNQRRPSPGLLCAVDARRQGRSGDRPRQTGGRASC